MQDPLAQDIGLFRDLLDAAPDPTVIVAADASIVLVNAQVTNVLGYTRQELVGQQIEILVPERFRSEHPGLRDGFLSAPAARPLGGDRELFALHKDGRELPVEISLAPLYTGEGMLVSAALRDITERKRMQEEAVRMREELIATVSHELRTPLTSIIGSAEMLGDLAERELSPRARELVGVIERNAGRELRLIDDLLTMAFLDGRRLRIALAPVDLTAVGQRVVDDLGPRADDAGLELSFDGEELAPVFGDFYRLVQVVENLVSNALKFTPSGGSVAIIVRAGGPDAVLEVADTGIGVSGAEQPKLFDRLYRSPSAVAAHVQGAGLGLSIVQKIIEAHDGTVEVESELGAGTTFRVRLPYS